MTSARIKQGLIFLFGKYHEENDSSVKKILSNGTIQYF